MKFILLTAVLFITGCAGHHSQQTKQAINIGVEREISAWEQAEKKTAVECSKYRHNEIVPPENAVDFENCRAQAIKEFVAPVALAPDLLMKLLIDSMEATIAYKKGEIDRDEVNIKKQRMFLDYLNAVDLKMNGIMNTAIMQDQQLAREQQAYFQNLSQQLRQEELERQRIKQQNQQNNRIKQTHCYGAGNHLDCTTM